MAEALMIREQAERGKELRKYYRLEDDKDNENGEIIEDDRAQDKGVEGVEPDRSSSEDEAAGSGGGRTPSRVRGIRGSDSEASDSESESDPELAEEAEAWEPEEVGEPQPSQHIEATARLAVMDLDWDRVSAVDLFVVLRSFAPKGGAVRRVTVYPSDFGLQRMAVEQQQGPVAVLRQLAETTAARRSSAQAQHDARAGEDKQEEESEHSEQGDADSDEEDVELDEGDADSDEGDADSDEEDVELDEEAATRANMELRAYERARLRYFYAVAECDSARTAAAIYAECDEAEFEPTGNKMDLRYISDDTEFGDRTARDEADSVPSDYSPPDLNKHSLQHTKVVLGWDKTEDKRSKLLKRRVDADAVAEDDLRAYLGSDSDREEEEEASKRDAYRSTLLAGVEGGGAGGGGDRFGAKTREWGGAASGGNVTIKFVPGLQEKAKKVLERATEKKVMAGENVWEASQRAIKAKKKERRRLKSLGLDPATSEQAHAQDNKNSHDEGFEDAFFDEAAEPDWDNARSDSDQDSPEPLRRQVPETVSDKKMQKVRQAKAKAELELLMMSDEAIRLGETGPEAGARAPALAKEARKKRKQNAKKLSKLKAAKASGRAGDVGEDEVEAGGVDVKDSRFQALFTHSSFALDPTHPRYKASAGTVAIVEERKRLRSQGVVAAKITTPSANATSDRQEGMGAGELSSMVASLKRKSKVSVPDGKRVKTKRR